MHTQKTGLRWRHFENATYVILIRSQNIPMNDNRLAELIREISQKRLAVPCLSGAEPLQLLLEIGLEKALKDYEHIFKHSKICSAQDLSMAASAQQRTGNKPATNNTDEAAAAKRQTLMLRNQSVDDDEDQRDTNGFQNSTFNRTRTERQLDRLAHVHLLMEHLMLIQIHLNWSDSEFRGAWHLNLVLNLSRFFFHSPDSAQLRSGRIEASTQAVCKLQNDGRGQA